jgi:hypothetical protein
MDVKNVCLVMSSRLGDLQGVAVRVAHGGGAMTAGGSDAMSIDERTTGAVDCTMIVA